jgi:hypothetical protein
MTATLVGQLNQEGTTIAGAGHLANLSNLEDPANRSNLEHPANLSNLEHLPNLANPANLPLSESVSIP